jgi:tRNA(fMet)-specific endonuclease VapC
VALYLLDTTTFTLLRHGHARVVANLAAHANDTIGLTSINVEEVLTGWYTRVRRAKTKADQATASRLLAEAVTLLGRFPIYPLTEPAIDRYAQLVGLRLNVGKNDLRIASLALELGAAVVTNNARDFGRVRGLVVEDWSV